MADYYVNPRRGNDSNTGSVSRPLQTISKASEQAAEDDRSTGTIFLEPGIYSALEDFPILIPPLYALVGRGSSPNDCRIEYTGGIRNEIAVQGGSRVSNLTVVAAPPTDAPSSCNFSIGLMIKVEGAELDNVGIKTHESVPVDGVGFGVGMFISDADANATQISVDRSDILILNSDSVLTDCRVLNGGIRVGEEGAMRVQDSILTESYLSASTSTNALLEGNSLNGGLIKVSGKGYVESNPGPTIRSNLVRNGVYDALTCDNPGNATIENNTISAKRRTVTILNGASPTLRNNYFELLNLDGDYRFTIEHLLWITAGGRGFSPGPLIEGNFFVLGTGVFPLRPMWIKGPADFGGGTRGSVGMNFFRLPVGFFMDFDYPGHYFARDNFWNYVPAQFKRGSDTTVDVDGDRLDPGRITR